MNPREGYNRRKAQQRRSKIDTVTTTELPPIAGELDLGGWNVEQAFNARNWLETALKNSGATVNGAGMGLGGCDVSFTLDGVGFNVTMMPILIK